MGVFDGKFFPSFRQYGEPRVGGKSCRGTKDKRMMREIKRRLRNFVDRKPTVCFALGRRGGWAHEI